MARYQNEFGKDYDPEFTPADLAALSGTWSWLMDVVHPAIAAGPGAEIDDNLAYVTKWEFDPMLVTAPVLLIHRGLDRLVSSSHGEWLASRCPLGSAVAASR